MTLRLSVLAPTFAVSTYDPNYLLVRDGDLAAAVGVLRQSCQVTEM